MTTPTDAQIGEILRECASNGLAFNHEEAQMFASIKASESNLARCYLALTAAAEVRPKLKGDEAYYDGYCHGHEEGADATIERCAQVAKDRADFWHKRAQGQPAAIALGDECEAIFVAIRALKDKT